eukprot:12390488-Heterocapsa_arctica.AAC.1
MPDIRESSRNHMKMEYDDDLRDKKGYGASTECSVQCGQLPQEVEKENLRSKRGANRPLRLPRHARPVPQDTAAGAQRVEA